MNKILKNIHWLFWAFTLFSLIYGVYAHFKMADSVLDFNIHDTIFIVSCVYVLAFQSLIFFMFGLAYFLYYNTDKYKPLDSLSAVHILLTIVGWGVLFFIPEFAYKLPVESTADMLDNLRGSRRNYNIKAISLLGVLLAQLLFLINLIVVVLRK